MHGSGGERWKQRRHMWPVHSNSTAVACELSAPDFFLKVLRVLRLFYPDFPFLSCIYFFIVYLLLCCVVYILSSPHDEFDLVC